MAKRMIDTELWNDENIIEHFTAEDKYFWLYVLTSPHINICGIFKNSPALIARDMGLHKDTIVNLIYRFENVHHRIVADSETNEIAILNWYKYNWSKSPKLRTLIEKETAKIESKAIQKLVKERIKAVFDGDTVSIPYAYPSNTITNKYNNKDIIESNSLTTDNNNNSNVNIDSSNKTVVVSIEEISNWFDIVYAIYPRKVSKVQSKRTFEKKLIGLELEQAKQKVKAIKRMLETQCEVWKKENNGEGRQLEYIPHCSTWLNQNVEDSTKPKGKR